MVPCRTHRYRCRCVTAFGADGVEGGTDDTIVEAVKVGNVYYAIDNSGEVTPAAGASAPKAVTTL